MAAALLLLFGFATVMAWMVADAAGGRTGRWAFQSIAVLAAAAIVAGTVLLR